MRGLRSGWSKSRRLLPSFGGSNLGASHCCQRPATIFARSFPEISLECFHEGCRGVVTCISCDGTQFVVSGAQPYGGCIQPQPLQVAQRRLTNQLGELLRKNRTRQTYLATQRCNCPSFLRPSVKLGQRWPDVGIANRRQPSVPRRVDILFKVRAHSLNEQNIRKPCDYYLRAG